MTPMKAALYSGRKFWSSDEITWTELKVVRTGPMMARCAIARVSMRDADVTDEGDTYSSGILRSKFSEWPMIADFPTPGGATSMIYMLGYMLLPFVRDQTRRSNAADKTPIPAHFRKISGDSRFSVCRIKEVIQFCRRRTLPLPAIYPRPFLQAIRVLVGV